MYLASTMRSGLVSSMMSSSRVSAAALACGVTGMEVERGCR